LIGREALIRPPRSADRYSTERARSEHSALGVGRILVRETRPARIFAAGGAPDWEEMPEDSLPGVFEHETHDCGRFDIADTVESLGVVARSMADFAESLTPEQQAVVAVYAEGWVINTTAVIRHALHDAEHHLLDVRRGIARQQLRGWGTASGGNDAHAGGHDSSRHRASRPFEPHQARTIPPHHIRPCDHTSR